MDSQPAVSESARPPDGARYRIDALLGRGGVASVYRAFDSARDQVVALKRLDVAARAAAASQTAGSGTDEAKRRRRRAQQLALFQREYHSLAQLAHPRIIEVYDYGVDREGPYYTMELLEGQDLSALAPMRWQRACEVLRDVASALTLMHARRLLHRDISPRNVHCTPDGPAKLIDFGAMTAMGLPDLLVGTPSFIAPEALQRQALDARADLYSLGALGYFLLTGRPPYPARDFAQLRDAQRSALAPPSAYAPDVPKALDALILQVLSLDRGARPSSAVELVERLTALAGLDHDPRLAVPSAYLTAPGLVGRARELVAVRRRALRAARGHGATVIVSGPPGMGCSRFLDACALEGKIAGAIVLRAAAGAARSDHGAMRSLLLQLHASLGEVDRRSFEPSIELQRELLPGLIWSRARSRPTSHRPARAADPGALAQALHEYLARLAASRSLMILIDDFHAIDENSAAVIAALAPDASGSRLVLVVAYTEGAQVNAPSALRVLREHGRQLPLAPLAAHESEALLRSMFGAVPNLALVADRLHEWSDGRPLLCMQLAQHMVDCGVIRYEAGGFVLPEALAASDLPESVEAAVRARVARLPGPARELGAVVALCTDLPIAIEQCFALSELNDRAVAERALSDLVAAQLAVVDDEHVRLRQASFANVLAGELQPERLRSLHGAIADLLIAHGDLQVLAAEHYFLAEQPERGIDALLHVGQRRLMYEFRSTYHEVIARAIEACARLDRPARDAFLLRRLRLHHDLHYLRPCDREELLGLVHDVYRMAGLAHWDALAGQLTGQERLTRALELAVADHDATAERDRIYHPLAAIEELANLLAAAAGYGVSTFDGELLERLPSMAPYTPLSPAIELMESVARALRDLRANRHERYTQAIRDVLSRIDQPDRAGLPADTYPVIRLSIMYAVALTYGSLGNPRAFALADEIEALPSMRSSAWRVRLIAHLHLGDAHQAEQCRRQLELSLIQHGSRQAHRGTTLETEVMCYAAADDLLNLRRLLPELAEMARAHPGWQPLLLLARGELERIRGRLPAALELYERTLELARPGKHYIWSQAAAFHARALVELGRAREARELALWGVEFCREREMGIYGVQLSAALASAEAALGEHAAAIACADALIAEVEQNGIAGFYAGYQYELRARLAVLVGDAAGFARNLELCRSHYGGKQDSPFAPRLARLINEARSANLAVGAGAEQPGRVAVQRLRRELAACDGLDERAHCALALLIETTGALCGHLYGVRGERLALLASRDAHEPAAELAAELEAFVAAASGGDSQNTAVIDEHGAAPASAPEVHDAAGLSYQPFLIATAIDTAVAALALRFAPGERRAPPAELLAAVAEELAVRGDVTAFATLR